MYGATTDLSHPHTHLLTHPIPTIMTANGACEGCTCGRAEGLDVPVTDREPRSFTVPAEGIYSPETHTVTEGIDSAVPLRSKKWFHDDDDPGEFVFRTAERDGSWIPPLPAAMAVCPWRGIPAREQV